ncbi:MarR family transcriptional regulator [Haloferax marisrubri]|uniref:MarR family transcriptional regulator n=2 Tax=Haloferax marisrubri TaxID=1544719 RepID=A0A2P4NM41_9EURY|nr:MarR family transcriptional regulator [Haloferax marisrubri]
MIEKIHIIPVGFDYERLFQPITQGKLDADKIYLLHSARKENSEEVQGLAQRMVDKLDQAFGTILGKEVKIHEVEDIFKFEDIYPRAYKMIKSEVDQKNEVWVNISSMPRTVAFAFATAANALVVENPELRDRVHTYYVSPERYLITEMIEELKKESEFLEQQDGQEFRERNDAISGLLDEIESSGTTKGASRMNGGLHVEFPVVPFAELHDFEIQILEFLAKEGEMESTSELARELAEDLDEDLEMDSFKSKVQYNVKQLEKKGFVKREQEKNRYKPGLSTMGELWVQTH